MDYSLNYLDCLLEIARTNLRQLIKQYPFEQLKVKYSCLVILVMLGYLSFVAQDVDSHCLNSCMLVSFYPLTGRSRKEASLSHGVAVQVH